MNKICIKNVTLISMDDKRDKIQNNIDILIEGRKISKIGKNILIDNNTKVIYGTDKVAMPGLINTHAHVPMSIFRETLDGYNLQDWLNKKIWPMEDKLKEEDIYYASLLSFIEMIETGCTTINDMYFMTEEIIHAMKKAGIRLQTTVTMMNLKGDVDGERRISKLQSMMDKYSNENLSWNVGIHGLYTSTLEYVKKCISFANQNNLLVHMHFCENKDEVSQIENSYHQSPVKVLTDNFKESKILLAHAVKLTNAEIDKIKKLEVSISHCPVSNLKLGCGIANIKEMLDANINVCLGTDGQGSGSSLDMFDAMKFTALLQKGKEEDPTLLPAYQVLKMATINGAKALNLDDKIGSIEVGKEADIIILNLNNSSLKPINNLLSEIVYNVKGCNVETTIVAGNILMENKKIKLNKNEIYNKCENIIDRIC